MKKNLLLLILALSLTGCGFRVHKMNIEQGNLITPEMARQLHVGMSEEQVRNMMGSPVLINTFDDHHLNYVYTYKPGYGNMKEENVVLVFRRGVLKEIKNNVYNDKIGN